MADVTEPPGRLEKEEALALARQGKDAWNAWAEEHEGWYVDFSHIDFTFSNERASISFRDFIFPGEVSFSRSKFGTAHFTCSKFVTGPVNFVGTVFSDDAWFDEAHFSGGAVHFSGSEFLNGTCSFEAAFFATEGLYFNESKFLGQETWFDKITFCCVDQTAFRNTVFKSAETVFDNSIFESGAINFKGAKFLDGYASFERTKFLGGGIKFQDAVFAKAVRFVDAVFEYPTDFSRACFEGSVVLKGACFRTVPDFRYTNPKVHFTLHGVEVGYQEVECEFTNSYVSAFFTLWPLPPHKSVHVDDVDKFRRLKELAVQSRDHEREQNFFAKELKAKRYYETDFSGLIWSYLYEWFSNFGRSIYFPIRALIIVWFLFGLGYWVAADQVGRSLSNGLKLSASVLVPFVAAARTSYTEAKLALYGKADMSLVLDLFVIFEGILGLAFVFLIGLALRNRFRI